MRATLVAALASVLASTPAFAQSRPVAIDHATLLIGTGERVEGATLVYRHGKIEAIGKDVELPGDAERIDGTGLVVTPGFIDAGSTFGLRAPDASEETLMAPAADVLDRFAVRESDGEWMRAGVTTTYVGPSGRSLLGGYGAVVKLDGTIVRRRAAMSASFGETALDAFESPTTRQGMIATLRQTFIRSGEDSLQDWSGRAIASVLERDVPLRVLANTPDDILTALRLAEEFELDLVLESAAGGHEVARAIAAAGVPVVVGPAILGIGDGGPYEAFAHTPANAAKLAEAGITIALGTLAAGGRSVAMEGVVAKAHGLSPEATLRALTLDAAHILGVEGRLGSLESGKDADLVIWEGDPVGTWGETRRVVIGGTTVFER